MISKSCPNQLENVEIYREIETFLHQRSKSQEINLQDLEKVVTAIVELENKDEKANEAVKKKSKNEPLMKSKSTDVALTKAEEALDTKADDYTDRSMLLKSLNLSQELIHVTSPPSGLGEIPEIVSIVSCDPNVRVTMGPIQLPDGSVYEGQWMNGMKDGQGTLVSAHGSRYDGSFVEDQYEGKGTIVFANGDKYEGDWVRSKKQGSGVHEHSNGFSYDGDWYDDKEDGFGRHKWPDGSWYEGGYR